MIIDCPQYDLFHDAGVEIILTCMAFSEVVVISNFIVIVICGSLVIKYNQISRKNHDCFRTVMILMIFVMFL